MIWFYTIQKSPFQFAIVDEVNSYRSKKHCRVELGLVLVYQNRKKEHYLTVERGKDFGMKELPC